MLNNAHIVTFSGSAGAGKDAAAAPLLTAGYVNMALADPIKRIARDVYGVPEEQLWGASKLRASVIPGYGTASEPLTVRRVLQVLGTEVSRSIDPSTWIACWYRSAVELCADPYARYHRELGVRRDPNCTPTDRRYIVVTDVRFPNELSFFRSINATSIVVRRKGSGLSGSSAAHQSEQRLPDHLFDHVLENDDTLETLHTRVRTLVMGA